MSALDDLFADGRRPFILAPMAGFTNSVCRKIFREYGADAAVSEFVYSRAVLSGSGRVFEKLRLDASERPAGVQLFGSDPCELAEAALKVEEEIAPDFIDINFGCPAPNAVCAGAGAALLKTPKLMAAIVKKVSESLKSTPCTAKTRTGWSASEIIVPDVLKMLEDSGAKMLTVHGRTKAQGYSGESDWALIERCARAVKVPLVGNGSVEKLTAEDFRSSACSGFMIGRAALGNPWIFSQLKARAGATGASEAEPTPSERAKLALKYAELISSGNYAGISSENLKHAKVQIMRFLKNAQGFKKLRVGLKDVETLDELKSMLCEYVR